MSRKHPLLLSNLKLLRLGLHDNICGPDDVEYIDQIFREILIDKVEERHEMGMSPEEDQQHQSNHGESATPQSEIADRPIRKRIPVLNSFSYIDSPDTVVNSAQTAFEIHLRLTAQTEVRKPRLPNGLPKEVVQMQRLSKLSAWRKATMDRLNAKLKKQPS